MAYPTTIPSTFGSGGANLSPSGSQGLPTLKDVLTEHATALPQKVTLTVGEADLTAATNGLAQTINIGSPLPTGARILGCELTGNTQFTGGSATSVTLSVGGTGTTDIVNAADVLGGGTGNRHGTFGPNPNGNLGGQQLVATFTPDASHQLVNLTAGAVTITVFYQVLV